ncbi:MAG: ribonuclease H-like YkuK family protein [Candidatus Spechtbacterales bacterium]
MVERIRVFTEKDPEREYRVIIGSDSEGYGNVEYVSAVVVHCVGVGGIAFICKNVVNTSRSLRQKIYNETLISLSLANEVVPLLTNALGEKFLQEELIIHIDVGQKGETKDMIKEIAGMARGYGFRVATKPDSFAASNVADRFARPPGKEALAQSA